MKVLLTGNLGYAGSVMGRMLEKKGHDVTGFDTNYYAGCGFCAFSAPEKQIFKDIRNATIEDLRGAESVIHLAALSNDPLGELNPTLTTQINYEATVKLAKLAKEAGVKRFVYAS